MMAEVRVVGVGPVGLTMAAAVPRQRPFAMQRS
jgi:hypothetical protein